jgi:hypothetical protein
LLCATLLGCSSPKTSSNDSTAESTLQPVVLPFDIPEQTILLVRVEPEAFDTELRRLDSLVDASVLSAFGDRSPAEVGIALMMSQDLGGANDILTAEPFRFEGLDHTRSSMLALSFAGNDDWMWRSQHRVPQNMYADLQRGLFARLYLPATAPDTLQKSIRENCESLRLACRNNFSIRTHDDHIVVDYRLGDIDGLLRYIERDPTLPGPSADPHFASNGSPALRAFVETDAAFGWYLKSEYLPAFAEFIGAVETLEALEVATPWNRSRLFDRGLALAGAAFKLSAPESREVQDSAVIVRGGEAIQADLILGYTPHGSEIGQQSGEPRKVSGIAMDDPAIAFELAYAMRRSADAAKIPDYFYATTQDQQRDRAEFLRTSGPWPGFVGMHNYSSAYLAGQEMLGQQSTLPKSEAVRGALDVIPSDSGPFPLELRGVVVIAMQKGANLAGTVRQLQQTFGAFAPSVAIAEAGSEDTPEIHIVFGGADTKPVELVEGDQMAANLSRVAATLEPIGVPPLLTQALRGLHTLELVGTRTESTYQLSARLGSGDVDPIPVANVAPTAEPKLDIPRCAAPTVRLSETALFDLERSGLITAKHMVEVLEAAETSCQDGAQTLRRMRSAWLQRLGVELAADAQFGRAQAAWSEACTLGAPESCSLVEDHNEQFANYVLTQTPREVQHPVEGASPPVMVSNSALVRLELLDLRGLVLREELKHDDVDWRTAEGVERLSRFLRPEGEPRLAVAPDYRGAKLAALANITRLPGGEHAARRLDSFRQPAGLTVVVKGPKDTGEIHLAPWSGAMNALHIEVGRDGLTVYRIGNRLSPLDGCRTVTICPAENLPSLIAKLDQAPLASQAEVGLEVAKAMNTSRLTEVLRDESNLSSVSIRVGTNVPFAVVAGVVAAVQPHVGENMRYEIVNGDVEQVAKTR